MGTQSYRADYLTAFESANDQLAGIYEEYRQLQLRKETLEEALAALEPFLGSARQSSYDLPAQPEPLRLEPQPTPQAFAEPVRPVMRMDQPIEPVTPPSFAPVQEVTTDPLQLRINRALGLAVA